MTDFSRGRSGAEDWQALFAWASNTGMDTSQIAVEVAPVDLAPGELGLIAKSRLEPGDVLAWAPTSLLLNKAKATEVWGDLVADLADRLAMSLLLVHERFVRGEQSMFHTYIRSLPTFDGDVSGPSFLWSEEEWQWLAGSDAFEASQQMAAILEDDFQELHATLFSRHPEAFPAHIFTRDNFLWGAAVVASRAYGDDEMGRHLSIAPMVDFLNHQAGALQLTRFGNGIVAYSGKYYDPGEQVFVSYGGKSNAQLLTQYGFVDEDNREEAIYLRVGLHFHVTEPHAAAKRALLAELIGDGNNPEQAIFKVALRPRDWEARLLPAARVLALGAKDPVPASVHDFVQQQPPHLEAAALGLLNAALERRRAEYPEGLAEARQRLAAGGLEERHGLGLRLRVSEQELLELALQHVAEHHEFQLTAMAQLTVS